MQKTSFREQWLPHPFVSILVGLSWLMLAHSISAGNLLIAFILAMFIPRLIRPFIAYTPDIHWNLAIKLFLVVLWDIILSNIRIAKLVLGPTDQLQPKWFRVPLETDHEQVNTLLAMIITTTPGTVTAGIDQDFKITPAQLEAAITPKTKALILCSPSNPTGSVYTKEELAGLAAVLAKHPQVYVIADEIYEHITYSGKHESIAQFPEIHDNVIIVNGVSKAYAMTGWRIGFIAGPEWIVKAVNKLQGQYTSGPCSVSQKAAEAAYTGTQAPVEEMRQAFQRRRDLIVKLAKEIPGFEVNNPQGAFYLFPKCDSFFGKSAGDRNINNADDLAMYLLEVGHVACVGGTSFGSPECIRMSYATSDENIIEAMRRIKEALALLK